MAKSFIQNRKCNDLAWDLHGDRPDPHHTLQVTPISHFILTYKLAFLTFITSIFGLITTINYQVSSKWYFRWLWIVYNNHYN